MQANAIKHPTLEDDLTAIAAAKHPKFADKIVTEVISVCSSPESIMARGAAPPPLYVLPPPAQTTAPATLKLSSPKMLYLPLLVCAGITVDAIAAIATAAIPTVGLPVLAGLDLPLLCGVAIAGFLAQLVDGALGMGYGLTSSSVLVGLGGLSPRTASEVVHLAQLGTTLLSGLAHLRQDTVDRPTTRRLALPGVVGALLGAFLLTSLPTLLAKHLASALLLVVGLRLLLRFQKGSAADDTHDHSHDEKAEVEAADKDGPQAATRPSLRLLIPVGLLGGFIDVAGGGGWGPVATTSLLASGRLPPAKAIGTVSLSEFFVTVAAVAGLALASYNHHAPRTAATGLAEPSDDSTLRLDLMASLLVGGLLAAPLAPRLVTTLKPNLLGALVGGFIVVTNLRTLLKAAAVSSTLYGGALGGACLVWAALAARVARGGGSGGAV